MNHEHSDVTIIDLNASVGQTLKNVEEYRSILPELQ